MPSEVFTKSYELMKKCMADYDPSHDYLHVLRVHKTAIILANHYHADPVIVEVASLLHDVMDAKYSSKVSESELLSFMTRDLGLSHSRAERTLAVIVNCSYSKEKRLRAEGKWTMDGNIEWQCVSDADRLDSIGAFGVFRCAAYSAAKGTALHNPSDPAATAYQHFYDKLFNIQNTLCLPMAKAAAQKRAEFLQQTIKQMDIEFAGDDLKEFA